jgi:polar amino acid transport system permease protein
MSVVFQNGWLLLDGLWVTIQVTIGAGAVALVLAFMAGLSRLSRYRAVRTIALCYIEFFRGTSALVQLFWLFFALPFLGITLSPMTAGIVGLGLCVGAYGAEVVRSAVLAVPKGQIESAIALNLTSFQTIRHVVLPQAVRMMIPPFGNLFIELLKITSLVSLITLQDLTFQAASINAVTLKTVQIFSTVLVLYFLLSLVITGVMRLLERRFGRGFQKAATL